MFSYATDNIVNISQSEYAAAMKCKALSKSSIVIEYVVRMSEYIDGFRKYKVDG